MKACPAQKVKSSRQSICLGSKCAANNSRNLLRVPGQRAGWCSSVLINLFIGRENQASFLGMSLLSRSKSCIRKRDESDLRYGNGSISYESISIPFASWSILFPVIRSCTVATGIRACKRLSLHDKSGRVLEAAYCKLPIKPRRA